jgi:hypothetical protein
MKYLIKLDTLFATLFIFFSIAFIGFLGSFVHLDFLDPVGQALKDLETTDVVFSQMQGDQAFEDEVVLVNIGEVNRATIAKQIEILNKYEPSVIGLDIRFIKDKTPDQDFPLMMAFAKTKNLVLGGRMYNEDSLIHNNWMAMETSNIKFIDYGKTAFVNMKTNENDEVNGGFRTSRVFIPTATVQDSTVLSFAAKICDIHRPETAKKLLERGNYEEIINWRGDVDPMNIMNSKFLALDVNDVLEENFDPSMVKGKILLFGFMGRHLRDEHNIEDMFYTPLNERMAGRAYPDMYGVVVHANIISMILHEKYIDHTPFWVGLLITFLLVYLNVALFLYIADRHKVYYDLITKGIGILETILIMGLIVGAMASFHLKIELTGAIIAVLLAGDLTELYAGSIRDLFIKLMNKLGI